MFRPPTGNGRQDAHTALGPGPSIGGYLDGGLTGTDDPVRATASSCECVSGNPDWMPPSGDELQVFTDRSSAILCNVQTRGLEITSVNRPSFGAQRGSPAICGGSYLHIVLRQIGIIPILRLSDLALTIAGWRWT